MAYRLPITDILTKPITWLLPILYKVIKVCNCKLIRINNQVLLEWWGIRKLWVVKVLRGQKRPHSAIVRLTWIEFPGKCSNELAVKVFKTPELKTNVNVDTFCLSRCYLQLPEWTRSYTICSEQNSSNIAGHFVFMLYMHWMSRLLTLALSEQQLYPEG